MRKTLWKMTRERIQSGSFLLGSFADEAALDDSVANPKPTTRK